MSQWKKITIRVMRYVTLLLIVGFVALLLIYTSGSNRPFEKVEKSVEASLDKEKQTPDLQFQFGRLYYGAGTQSDSLTITVEERKQALASADSVFTLSQWQHRIAIWVISGEHVPIPHLTPRLL